MSNLVDFLKKYKNIQVECFPNRLKGIPLVSVCIMTYQHVKYIKECLDGVLKQETDFDFEILLGEDDSTDGTREICIEYAKMYPEKIKLYLHHRDNNIFIDGLPSGRFNFIYNLLNAKGKYIAICEGDDYWIDSKKLQKQVDFLESNSDYSMVCHSSNEIDAEGNAFKVATRSDDVIDLPTVLGQGWFIRTASILFRREALPTQLPKFFFNSFSGDYILQVIVLKNGNCKYLPEVMSAYRRHDGGVSQTIPSIQIKRWIKKLTLLDQLDTYTNLKYTKEIKRQKSELRKNISLYCLKFPSIAKEIELYKYFEYLISVSLIKVVLKKINTKLFRS